ncbi:MAG: plastocyanin/azurin family copper-binding protein [Frankia sp.]
MTMSGTPTTGASAAGPASATAANEVSISNFAFLPATVTVRVGTTVTWTNKDSDAHTVTDKTGTLNSPTLDTGATYRHTFTKPGRYSYLCTIHPFMTATVVVTP